MATHLHCAYVQSTRLAVEFALCSNSSLFTETELVAISSFQDLSNASARVFSRILTRRATWIKPSSVKGYLLATSADDNGVEQALQALAAAGLVDAIHERMEFEEAWQAMESVCKADDILDLYKQVCGAKYKGAKSTKEEVLAQMRRAVLSQKTYFGGSLASTFAKKLVQCLKDKDGCGCPFRIKESAVVLFRRVQRLYQMTSSLPTGSNVSSAYEPLQFYAPLLATFKVVTYAPYPLAQAASSAIFQSRQQFLQWEAAMELRAMLEQLEHAEEEAEDGNGCATPRIIAGLAHAYDLDEFSAIFLNDRTRLGDIITKEVFAGGELLMNVYVSGLLFLLSLVASSAEQLDHALDDDYMIRYQAGTSLAYLATAFAAEIEKGPAANYVLAAFIYELLLALPFLQHRRGKWYVRLAIDCDHLKQLALAKTCVDRGLGDGQILLSDEIDLRDRAAALAKKAANKANKRKQSTEPADADNDFLQHMQRISDLRGHPKDQLALLSALIISQLIGRYITPVHPVAADTAPTAAQLAWNCPTCTFLNADKLTSCGVCGARRSALSSCSSSSRQQTDTAPKPNSTAPSASSSSISCTWACMQCTFVNGRGGGGASAKAAAVSCEVCAHPRPSPSTSTVVVASSSSRNNKGADEVIDLLDSEDDDSVVLVNSTSNPVASTCREYNYPQVIASLLSNVVGDSTNTVDLVDGNDSDGDGEGNHSSNVIECCRDLRSSLSPAHTHPSSLALQCFIVQGKRFGNVSKRKGKSRFVGTADDGDLLTVEQLVMEKCLTIDHDSCSDSSSSAADPDMVHSLYNSTASSSSRGGPTERMYAFDTIPYEQAVQGAGWRGWHCEGSILRSLFGLLMWDVFFSAPTDSAAVFLTPYQDGPLDFPYPSYFRRRQALIGHRVLQLAACSQQGLIDELAAVYRQHFGQRCAIVSWEGYSLTALQLAALCIGGPGLAVLCHALSYRYRQFSAGAPDLFLLRVRRRKGGEWQTVDLDEALQGWRNPPTSRAVPPANSRYSKENWLLRSPTKPKAKAVSMGMGMGSQEDQEHGFPTGRRLSLQLPSSSSKRQRDDDDEPIDMAGLSDAAANLNEDYDLLPAIPATAAAPDRAASSSPMVARKRPAASSPAGSAASSPAPSPNRQRSSDSGKLTLSPVRKKLALQEKICSNEPSLDLRGLLAHDDELCFESLSVEVKGPTDHLAYKQVLWLQLLALMGPGLRPLVCHVKED